ncbi:gliding motility-associated C-terminal domain-containing protein [Flavobacterium caseinilyticum]|uniref:Gliding motility-associated C-terminal domain-containing protein n=1 Tax=Flavobacterium caseinilyticum TaxID=2541732 RepID=A0A4R5AM88_9FLAO|nr:gliding motility-associated C-terminal domain-containing protein [Flavobacterium caseinilyticum]TDD74048.1 gliding motility-associated C-terminal domain-containing protein [Flavobacterium caseinilyticum]
MKQKLRYLIISLFFMLSNSIFGQDISLYKQFNGRYDFLYVGNTLNKIENGTGGPCEINTSSSATLNLNPGDVVEKAYLYWAGSGNGDFNITLNNQNIIAERSFNVLHSTSALPYFSAFADITAQIQITGNGDYDLSDLDLTSVIDDYCWNGTNFGGWAIVIIYKNPTLPLNQLNVYDGLQYVPNEINITLSSLNVIDNLDAKIGFVAWEGDQSINVNETLRINGNPIGNPPLNPVDNAFNGTNSFTNSTTLYNMDLDVYNIQNNIKIGDSSAEIQLTSGQDFVMINAIVTKLNSQLPDATIQLNKVSSICDSRQFLIDYTVFNANSTASLPAGMPIAIYIDGVFIKLASTLSVIPINGSESNTISIIIPDGIVNPFDLEFIVDDIGNRIGIVTEVNENNNTAILSKIALWSTPKFNPVPNIETCNQGLGRGTFDFTAAEELVKVNPEDLVSFYTSREEAENEANRILNPTNFVTETSSQEIFIRVQNENCFSLTSFIVTIKNCPPVVHNYFSPNNDGLNDTFVIDYLRNIFLNYRISIYNRWGTLVWTGDSNSNDWDGFANQGLLLDSKKVADGTYYYVIDLNDRDYSKPLVGYLFLKS